MEQTKAINVSDNGHLLNALLEEDGAIDRMASAIGALEAKLETVLSPERQAYGGGDECGEPAPYKGGSEATRLALENSGRLQEQTDRLRYLTDRLET